jgi:hypothetical protein
MTALPLPFRSIAGKYAFIGQPKLLNVYPEKLGEDQKAPLALLPCPGLTSFCSITDTPCRGNIYVEDLDVAYSAHSSGIFKITSAGVSTRVGALPGTDTVQFSRNQATIPQISVHCDAGEYYIEADVVKKVSDPDLPTAISQDHAGGYTAYGIEDGRFFLSSLNACQTVDGLDFATAESSADKLVRVKADRGDLFLFSQKTVEQWRNTGNADFPFEPSANAIQKGLVASDAVVPSDNTLMFPGEDNIVYRLSGSAPQRISTHDIERLLQNDTARESVIGFAHAWEGHSFATWTGTDWTKCYDSATQTWHDRQSYGVDNWRAQHSFRAWGKTLYGDRLSGKLFYLDTNAFVEDDSPLIWGIDSAPMHVFPRGAIVDALHLDLATGYGKVSTTAQGYDPLVMLSTSIDGGNTFRDERQLSIGKSGDRIRVTARRLGAFGPLGMVFRLRISDPVVRALINVNVDVRPLKR